jgi:hypothetical protein
MYRVKTAAQAIRLAPFVFLGIFRTVGHPSYDQNNQDHLNNGETGVVAMSVSIGVGERVCGGLKLTAEARARSKSRSRSKSKSSK